MRFKSLLTIFAAVALLAACESAEDTNKTTAGTGGTTPQATTAQIVPGTQQDLVANVGDRIFFDYNKSDLRPDARAQVQKWADWLKKYPANTVTIAGNCDERGTREYNLALGERRAAAAKKFLTALGIDGKRLATISYGKDRPAVVGSNEAAWAQNRNDQVTVN